MPIISVKNRSTIGLNQVDSMKVLMRTHSFYMATVKMSPFLMQHDSKRAMALLHGAIATCRGRAKGVILAANSAEGSSMPLFNKPFYSGPQQTKFINFVGAAPSKLIDIPVLRVRSNVKGEVTITSVAQLVQALRRHCTEHHAKIARLTTYAHANPQGVAIGNDFISAANFKDFRPHLSSIRDLLLSKVSFMHVASCQLGQHVTLLQFFSSVWHRATIRGFVQDQYAEDEWPLGTGPAIT